VTYGEAFTLLWKHIWGAFGMGLLFGTGMLLAIPVMRNRFRPLLFFPRIFADMLDRLLRNNPSTLRLAAFIFLFNSCAIFLYMLTGVVPFLPAVVALWAGLNVALAAILAQERFPPADISALPIPVTARIGAVMTFALEIPSFCFALAMGLTIQTRLPPLFQGADIKDIRLRALAYLMIIVPTLAISALAEAHAVCSAFTASKRGGAPDEKP